MKAVRLLRLVGIAIGSLVAATLAVSLVAGLLLGWTGTDNRAVEVVASVVAILLGGFVFADIMRRERPGPRR
jgi:hypothetical protein